MTAHGRGEAAGPVDAAPGVLRIVATPLGNLADLSPRARDALAAAAVIAAEDTRRSGRLLELAGLPKKPFLSYYAPREAEKARAIVDRLRAGADVALVTDGGTPGVADPGALVVAAARAAGIRVEPVPGPCAVALALSVSSFGGEAFVFEGFLPSKAGARRERIQALATEARTIVCYETPHRLAEALGDLCELLGPERKATIVREATKVHEEILEDRLEVLAKRFSGVTKGEIVLVLAGATPDDRPPSVEVPVARLLEWLVGAGLSADRAAREVAQWTGLARNPLVREARRIAEDR